MSRPTETKYRIGMTLFIGGLISLAFLTKTFLDYLIARGLI
jgi:hypothetical protein